MTSAEYGLLGVVLGFVLSLAKDWIFYCYRRKERARYSAVHIISILDEFAEECADVVYDDGTIFGEPAGKTSEGQLYRTPQVDLPPFPEFPTDIDWRILKADLMHRTLTLKNRVRETERTIKASWEYYSGPPYINLFEDRYRGYAELGLDALSIANSLRKQFRFKKQAIAIRGADYSLEDIFRQTLKQAEDRQKSRHLSNTQLRDELSD